MEAQREPSRWSVQPRQASPEEGVSLVGGHRYPTTPIPLLVWGISSPEAVGFWFACLSLAELTGRKVLERRGHGVGQRTNAQGVQTCPQLFIASLLCAGFCGGDMGHQDNLVQALGGDGSFQKVRIQTPNCYPGRGCGHPDWRVWKASRRKWPLG